jgi:hypothetical protein
MCDIQPRPWSEVVHHYEDVVGCHGSNMAPMLQLVEQIQASGFAERLFPYTSMFTLCIGCAHVRRMHQEELRITFDPTRQEFQFEYWSNPFDKPGPWKRTCPAAEGFATLERFLLKRVRWFKRVGSDESPQEPST